MGATAPHRPPRTEEANVAPPATSRTPPSPAKSGRNKQFRGRPLTKKSVASEQRKREKIIKDSVAGQLKTIDDIPQPPEKFYQALINRALDPIRRYECLKEPSRWRSWRS